MAKMSKAQARKRVATKDLALKDVKDLPASQTQDVTGSKLMAELLSNVSKTRSEISRTFARNSRA